MIMRIEAQGTAPPPTPDTAKAQTPVRSGAPAAAAVVQVSSIGAALSTGSTDVTPPAVAARIEKIRALLARGEYVVDLDALAAKMVDDDILRTRNGS
jgi:flagellar biosynthesis anti-sigma factor FlgM